VKPVIGIGNKTTVTNYSWAFTAKNAILRLIGKRLNRMHGATNRKEVFSWKEFIRRLTVSNVTKEEYFPARVKSAWIATGKIIIEWLTPIMLLNNFPPIVEYVTI
jgi:hypothetical protein